jgi:hypothetical protein
VDAVESISISNARCIESTRTMVSDLHRKGIASGTLMNRLRLYNYFCKHAIRRELATCGNSCKRRMTLFCKVSNHIFSTVELASTI